MVKKNKSLENLNDRKKNLSHIFNNRFKHLNFSYSINYHNVISHVMIRPITPHQYVSLTLRPKR